MEPIGGVNKSGHAADKKSTEAEAKIQALIARWRETELLLSDLLQSQASSTEELLEQDTAPFDNGRTGATPGQKAASLADEQIQLLDLLIDAPAHTVAGVCLKLKVWRDLVAPSGQDQDWLQPSDRLVLSALSDLDKIDF